MTNKRQVLDRKKVQLLTSEMAEKEKIKPSSISEERLKTLGQNLTPNFRNELIKTSKKFKWKKREGINSFVRWANLFENISTARLKEHKAFYVMLRSFNRYKELVELSTLWFCRRRSKSPFMGNIAQDNEVTLSAINTESLDKSATDRIYSVTSGENAKVFDKTFRDRDEMMILIGFRSTTNSRIIERAQITVTEEGQPITTSRMKYGNMNIMELPGGPVVIRDGQTLSIDLEASEEATTDFWPVGVYIGKAKERSLIKP